MNEHERNALADSIICLGPTQMRERINRLIDERDEEAGKNIINRNALRLRTDLCKQIYAAANGTDEDSSLAEVNSDGIWGRWCARLVAERKRLVAEIDDLRKLVSRQGADLLRACQQLCAYEGTAKDPGGPEALGLAVTCGCLRGELRTAEDLLRGVVEGLEDCPTGHFSLVREIQHFLSRGGVEKPIIVEEAGGRAECPNRICEVCDGGPGNDGVCACPKG